ncbi:MAG TPA: ABC transporter ATP-binding protein [Myxococcaceae bacterium]|nr:ABC transporter ATP-binding protein [Myxococcaceae bacterium]
MNTHLPIETRQLSKTYRLGFWLHKKVDALQGLDLRIEPGQVYGLLGPNGAGKSTAIKILIDLVRPTSGEARLFGLPPGDDQARRAVGFLPENPAPYEYLTGKEFLGLAGRLAGLSGEDLDRRVAEVLGITDMDRAANLQIRRYSKGMIQRIALGQALIHRPKLLILDEPTSGLDPVGRRDMRDLILAERERGTTVLFCTHIIPDVEALCDRVAVLVAGKRIREGSVQELVTAQVPVVELILEGISPDALQRLGVPLQSSHALGERQLVRTSDSDSQVLMRKVLDQGGRVAQMQPARFSLEDLFLKALEEAKQAAVGGQAI